MSEKMKGFVELGSNASARFTAALAEHSAACVKLDARGSECARVAAHDALDMLFDSTWSLHMERKLQGSKR